MNWFFVIYLVLIFTLSLSYSEYQKCIQKQQTKMVVQNWFLWNLASGSLIKPCPAITGFFTILEVIFRNSCNEMSIIPILQQFTDFISKENEAMSLLYVSFCVKCRGPRKVVFNNYVFVSQSQTSCKKKTNDWKCSYEKQTSKQAEGSSQVYWLLFCVLVF